MNRNTKINKLNNNLNNPQKKIQLIIEANLTPDETNIINKIAVVKTKLPCINSYIIELDETDLPQLKGIKGIKSLHSNTHITAQMNNARKTIHCDYAESQKLTGKGVTIAILDTGIAPLNDFIKPTNRIIAFKDFINNNSMPYDDNGHGTHLR